MRATRRDHSQPPRVTRRMRLSVTRFLPDLALGAVAALGLAPFGIWGVTVMALAGLIFRLSRFETASSVFRHALAGGIGWFAVALIWIVEPFLVEPEIYGWMAPFALILMGLGGGLFWAVPIWLAARICPGPRGRAAGMASALLLSDWLRGCVFTGFPWAQIGHVWVGTPVAQLAAWGGAIGLGVLTLTAASLPALLWRKTSSPILNAFPAVPVAIAIIGLAWAAGLARQAEPLPPDRELTLRIVQPNAEQRLKWDPEWSGVFFQRLLDLSAEPGARDLVIWPETAVNFLLNDAGTVLPAMSEAAGAPLVLGIQRRDGSRYFNSLTTIAPGGKVQSIYDKFHLVPFGEYIPWGDALARIGISAFAAQEGKGYTSGPGPRVMALSDVPDFQPLICYEAIFPQHLRNLENRPGWLLQVTNDGWFGKFSGPYQHLDQARLRAIETGLPLIRAANTGVSAVIDAHGSVRQRLPLGEVGKIDAALPGTLPPTPWLRWGPAPVLLVALFVLCSAAMSGRGSKA